MRCAARATTIRAAPRLSLVVEMHPQCWPAFGVTEQDARDTLDDLGLTARPLVEGEVALRARHARRLEPWPFARQLPSSSGTIMSVPSGDSFRDRTLSERIAAALPSGGRFGALRRRLKPLFAKWLAPGGGGLRSVLPGGEVVLVAPEFRHITWNPEEYTAFRAAVRPGDVVLEAGANVGAYTMLFAQWVGAAGRVFAFEPDPIAYAGLQKHIALNAVADRVTPVAAAVADGSAAILRLAIGESSGISRLVQPGEDDAVNPTRRATSGPSRSISSAPNID